jgi:hypothetical protein
VRGADVDAVLLGQAVAVQAAFEKANIETGFSFD